MLLLQHYTYIHIDNKLLFIYLYLLLNVFLKKYEDSFIIICVGKVLAILFRFIF